VNHRKPWHQVCGGARTLWVPWWTGPAGWTEGGTAQRYPGRV